MHERKMREATRALDRLAEEVDRWVEQWRSSTPDAESLETIAERLSEADGWIEHLVREAEAADCLGDPGLIERRDAWLERFRIIQQLIATSRSEVGDEADVLMSRQRAVDAYQRNKPG